MGQGNVPLDRLIGIRDERLRGSEFKVMPAKGLTMVEVGYPEDDGLAARADQTRARRQAEEAPPILISRRPTGLTD